MDNLIFTICTMLFILASVALVLVILVQKPQGGGLSAAFGAGGGGGASQTAFGTKTGDMLTLGTVGVFIFFIGISITLVLLSGARYGSRSGMPNPPENLTAIAESPNLVKLTWSDESNNEDRFIINRALSADAKDEEWLPIWSTVSDVEAHDDSAVLPGTTYFYRIVAANGSGPSDPTEIVEVTTPAATADPLLEPAPVSSEGTNDTPAVETPTNPENNAPEEGNPDPNATSSNEDDGQPTNHSDGG